MFGSHHLTMRIQHISSGSFFFSFSTYLGVSSLSRVDGEYIL